MRRPHSRLLLVLLQGAGALSPLAAHRAPGQQVPGQQAPGQQVPGQRAPAEEAPAAPAKQAPCDTLVTVSPDDPTRYQRRGDRCEGVYIQEVSGSSQLLVASLTESFENFDTASALPLRVTWTAPGGAAVGLRAYSLRYRLHYRMETVRPLAGSGYVWPTNVLRQLGMGRADVGVVGRTMLAVGGAPREVYVPLRIAQRAAPQRSPRYRVVLLPAVELSEVYVTLARAQDDGALGPYLRRDEPLGYGVYPAERAIAIDLDLPRRAARGLYRLQIGATQRSGGSSTAGVWLYHSGPPPGGTVP